MSEKNEFNAYLKREANKSKVDWGGIFAGIFLVALIWLCYWAGPKLYVAIKGKPPAEKVYIFFDRPLIEVFRKEHTFGSRPQSYPLILREQDIWHAPLNGYELNLYENSAITDESLKELANIRYVGVVNIGKTQITNEGFKELSRIEMLQKLRADLPQITDEGLEGLSKCKHLKHLSLRNTQITDAGIKELVKLSRLRYLDLDGTKITDVGLKELAKLSLETLWLHDTQITDAGILELTKMVSLRDLRFSGSKVTKGGAAQAQLKRALPECYIPF